MIGTLCAEIHTYTRMLNGTLHVGALIHVRGAYAVVYNQYERISSKLAEEVFVTCVLYHSDLIVIVGQLGHDRCRV